MGEPPHSLSPRPGALSLPKPSWLMSGPELLGKRMGAEGGNLPGD